MLSETLYQILQIHQIYRLIAVQIRCRLISASMKDIKHLLFVLVINRLIAIDIPEHNPAGMGVAARMYLCGIHLDSCDPVFLHLHLLGVIRKLSGRYHHGIFSSRHLLKTGGLR